MVLASILGILTYLLPSIVLYIAVRYIMQAYLENEEKKREAESRSAYHQSMLPLKLQASERLILLLERITPAQAINRALYSGMTAFELQLALLKNIREEYEHNVAQQLYVSPSCWAMIRSAKEEVIRLINLSASEGENGTTSADMARNLLLYWSQLEQDPVQSAISQLKKETTGN